MNKKLILSISNLILVAALLIVAPVSGQQKMSGREFDGLKGQVKSVTTVREKVESKNYYDNKLRTFKNLFEMYDQNGTRTENTDYEYNLKSVYTVIDGDLTSKSLQLVKSAVDTMSVDKIEQKPTQPEDRRYDLKYKFKFDAKGRRVETLIYGNTGITVKKIEYKFNDQGVLTEELRYDDGVTLNEQFLYKYETAGKLSEMQTILHRPEHNLISFIRYSNYKFDSTGNWIQRTDTGTQDYNGKELKIVTKNTRKIEYYK